MAANRGLISPTEKSTTPGNDETRGETEAIALSVQPNDTPMMISATTPLSALA